MATRPTRRRFLAASAGSAAGIALPHIFIPRYGWTANSRLGVASIGVGGRGTAIGNQAAGHGKMVACADVHMGNAKRFANHHKCDYEQDYRKVLARRDVDVITCGTTDHWHVKVALDAMKAGKDVYCEKPLTLTIDEGKIIGDAVKRTRRVFQVGTQQRSECDRRFLKAVAMCRSGRLGKKLKARVQTGGAPGGGPFQETDPPGELDWEMYSGQAPKHPFCKERIGWTFRWWLEYSGGQVTDWGVHHNDIALWALGGDETGLAVIQGRGNFPKNVWKKVHPVLFLNGKARLGPYYNVTPSYECDIKLPNGNEIHFTSHGGNDLILEGEKGTIRVNRGRIEGEPIAAVEKSATDKKWLDAEVAKLYRGMPIRGHMANFFHCVKTREKPISDVWTHVNSVNVCHMANLAMLLKRPLRWDYRRYKFIGDAEARALARRVQRKGYETKL
jgi:predicted dehydrogenase